MTERALPLPIEWMLRLARNAKSAKERHDTAYSAWEASVRLGFARHPAPDPSPLAKPSVGHWVKSLERPATPLDAPAILAAYGLFTEEGKDHRSSPRTVTGHVLLEPLAAYRNAVMGHASTRAGAFYEKAGPVLITGLEAAWDAGVFAPVGASLVFVDAIEIAGNGERSARVLDLMGFASSVLPADALGTVPDGVLPSRLYSREADQWVLLHPWLLFFQESESRESVLFFNGIKGSHPRWLDFVRGNEVDTSVLVKRYPRVDAEMTALLTPRSGDGRSSPTADSIRFGAPRSTRGLDADVTGGVDLASPRRRRPMLYVLLLAIVLAIGGGAGVRAVLRPIAERYVLEDHGEDGWTLVVEGRHLGRIGQDLRGPWLRALSAAGIVARQDAALDPSDDGRASRLRIEPPRAFRARALPAIESDLHSPVLIRARLRLAMLAYRDEDSQAGRKFATMLAGALHAATAGETDGVAFDETPYIEFRTESDYEPGNKGLTRADIDRFDLFYASPLIALAIERMSAPDAPAREDPVRWLACNVGLNDSVTYRSVLISSADSPIARWLPPGEHLSPEKLSQFLGSLHGDDKLEIYWGPKASTSGFAVPCLSWRDFYANPRTTSMHTARHDLTAESVLGAPAREASMNRIGVLNEAILSQLFARPDNRLAPYRILWRSDPIPHGGIFMRRDIPEAKREVYERVLGRMVEDTISGARHVEWPSLDEVKRLESCTFANIEEFERHLRGVKEGSQCLPSITPQR